MVKLSTNYGDITIEVETEQVPETSANFLQYVRDGLYDGTMFHRVIDGFMIQGGGMLPDFSPVPTRPPIKNEASRGLKNKTGTVAMARTNDPHSATSQFFINVADNDFLDYPGQDGWGYCAFGRVTEGMDVVEQIKQIATTSMRGHQDVPVEEVIIEKARIVD